jgi:hypothetical protein
MASSATKHFRSENKKQIKSDLQTSWWRIIASKSAFINGWNHAIQSGRCPFHDAIQSEFTIIPFMMQLFHSWCKVTRKYKKEKQRKKNKHGKMKTKNDSSTSIIESNYLPIKQESNHELIDWWIHPFIEINSSKLKSFMHSLPSWSLNQLIHSNK